MSVVSLGKLLARDGSVLVPGVGSALEARLVELAGFGAVYVSGYATAAGVHGLPDIGLLGRGEIVANVSRIANVTGLPLIVDADTGYGDVAAVAQTMRMMEAAGASAVQFEDQVWPKRCGHMAGKQVEPLETILRKIDAALSSRRSAETLVVARTDALAPLGIDEAIKRAARFAQAGADMIFVDAPTSVADLSAIASAVRATPLVVNVSEGGVTPALPAQEFAALGYKVILYPSTATRVAARAVSTFLRGLGQHGDSRGAGVDMFGLGELNEVVGLAQFESLEQEVLRRADGAC